ncbi:hypothetical protein [Apibacter adventoris]|uniref:hypothetical protein n=1 Tax=Apibacter adventoris TaxID=1679466 RepID=UPI000CF6EF58|nr:hypothetical protein [Apibacter adventoris]PQL94923.1 hypothetical protein C4S76_03315 [Apibacter adventoris]
MRYTLLIALLLLLLNCKTTRKETALLDTHKYTQKELQSKYYKFNGSSPYNFTIYTNVEGNPNDKNIPRSLFYPSMDEKNYDYFIDELDGQYVLYLEKDGKIIMREYGNYFSMNKLRDTDSLKWETSKMNSEQKIYDYLKNNNIKYKFISKKNDGIENIIKIQLIPSKYYTYIRFCGNYIVSNMYYQPQDTLPSSSYNKLGYLLLR